MDSPVVPLGRESTKAFDILEFGELFLFQNNSPDIRGNYRKEKKHTQNN